MSGYLCISMYLYVSLCISMYLYVSLCISMYIYVYLCISMYIYVYLCISMYIYVYLRISTYIYVYLRISSYIYVFHLRFIPKTSFLLSQPCIIPLLFATATCSLGGGLRGKGVHHLGAWATKAWTLTNKNRNQLTKRWDETIEDWVLIKPKQK